MTPCKVKPLRTFKLQFRKHGYGTAQHILSLLHAFTGTTSPGIHIKEHVVTKIFLDICHSVFADIIYLRDIDPVRPEMAGKINESLVFFSIRTYHTHTRLFSRHHPEILARTRRASHRIHCIGACSVSSFKQ